MSSYLPSAEQHSASAEVSTSPDGPKMGVSSGLCVYVLPTAGETLQKSPFYQALNSKNCKGTVMNLRLGGKRKRSTGWGGAQGPAWNEQGLESSAMERGNAEKPDVLIPGHME